MENQTLSDDHLANMQEKRRVAHVEFLKESQDFIENSEPHLSNFYKLIPDRLKKAWMKSYKGEASKTQAIKAKCYECVGFENAVEEIRNCAIRTCPLNAYRPYQKKRP
jgi:hypothetical protein